MTGIIEVFDKHWNIVLSDVYEIWKRRKLHHCAIAAIDTDPASDEQTNACLARLKSLNVEVPVTKVKSLNRKFAECSRRIPQLLIRGEQIAIITPYRSDDTTTCIKSQHPDVARPIDSEIVDKFGCRNPVQAVASYKDNQHKCGT